MMHRRVRAPLALLPLVLFAVASLGCGGGETVEGEEAFMSTPVDATDGYATCDAYCASLDASCVDGLTSEDVPPSHACNAMTAGFDTMPRTIGCTAITYPGTGGTPAGSPDACRGGCSETLWTPSLPGRAAPMSARCCCAP